MMQRRAFDMSTSSASRILGSKEIKIYLFFQNPKKEVYDN